MDHEPEAGPLQQAWGAAVSAEVLREVLGPPRHALPVPTAEDRTVWAIDGGRMHRATVADLLERAREDRGQDWPSVPARGYSRYVRDGDRIQHESRIAARQHRLSRASIAAAVTLDPEWIDEVADGVLTLCEQSSWCWPAHDDAYARRGYVLPVVDDPYLDLGAGEVAAQLAWVDHLLGSQLDEHVPGLRSRLRVEVHHRVITPFLQRRDWHWLGLDGPVHNWNPWIHQNVLTAAAALIKDDELRARVLATAITGLDRFVDAIPADGAIDEGFDYWWNGACRVFEGLAVLSSATGGRLEARQIPSLRATVGFPYALYLGGDGCFSFSDCRPRLGEQLPWHLLSRWAREVGDERSGRFALSRRPQQGPIVSEQEGLGRLLLGLTDQLWSQGPAEPPVAPRSHYLASTQVLIAHDQRGELSLAAKGGHNGENHNHNDVGSICVALRGRPVLVDPGRATYTAETFGPQRYELWNIRSDWHNVPEICGYVQEPGAEYRSEVGVELDGPEVTFDAELSRAYPRAAATRWRRRAVLSRTGGLIEVRDSWTGGPHAVQSPHRLHWILAGEAEHREEGSVSVTTESGTIHLAWDPRVATGTLEERVLEDDYQRAAWGERLTRLTLAVDREHVRQGSLTLRIRPGAH
ncbi:heparinase II/III domain-containing protein [Bogoriella caseilytica]|uniref:Heparinase II/III-like protein n=1 Tax=Bogoriella caseilytica TaxID=56055 RepID=A0A3N2BBK8_9MICO|nr:heparinase II/III family protein [Bogoriella caseilytica]ROR72643.1 heparinase II/III-like protein [Bogoriella caseilytica]